MTVTDRSQRRGWRLGSASVIASLVGLTALLVPLLADSTASATSLRSGSVGAATTCPTDAYTGSTIAPCGTTTTTSAVTIVIVVKIGYHDGLVSWQACGFPATAVGTTAQLYLGGELIRIPGGTAAVLAGGCTADPSFPICLVPGNYAAVAVDQFGQASATVPVTGSGCPDAISLAVSSHSPSATGTRGTNVVILLLIAALLIVLGYAIVRLNRQRRGAG
jgi:hypothetical protein